MFLRAVLSSQLSVLRKGTSKGKTVAGLAMILASGTVWAQFRTVTVQNAPSNPVPTTIQNTPNVNVSGGTVGVTGNVGITGTLPAVQIAPGQTVGITGTPSVNVANTPNVAVTAPVGTAGPGNTTGVLVKWLDNPARQPFQQALSCVTTPGGATSCSSAPLTVPAGKEFVIEYLQLNSFEFTGGSATTYYELVIPTAVLAIRYPFAPGTRLTSAPGFVDVLSEHQVRLYADPGFNIVLTGHQDTNATSVTFQALLSGYLVNVP